MSHEPWPFRHDSEQPPAEPIVSQETPLLFPSLGPSHYFKLDFLPHKNLCLLEYYIILDHFFFFVFCILFIYYLNFAKNNPILPKHRKSETQ